MKKREKLTSWVKENKKKVLVAGVGFVAIGAGLFIGVKEKDNLMFLFESIKEDNVDLSADNSPGITTFIKSVTEMENKDISGGNILNIPVKVSEHIRNLPSNQKPSLEKIALAAERGIELLPGQTLVDSYEKGMFVA